MNAIIKSQAADRPTQDALALVKALIEGQNFVSATHIYADLLETNLAPPLRSEIQTNLAAALCMLARQHISSEAALDQLERARDLLVLALQHRQLATAPKDWAATRANLAVVNLARYEATGTQTDILSAHLALDGIEPALHRANDPELQNWIAAIRDHLVELRERRSRRR